MQLPYTNKIVWARITSGSFAIQLPMAEAISTRKGSDQHRNIIWHINKNGVQILSAPNLSNRGEHLTVITRGTAVTYGTELYFSVSSYGYPCPQYWQGWRTPARIPHLVFKYNTSEDECFNLPACEVHDFGLAVVDGLVTVVGGEFDHVSPTVTMGPPPLNSSLYVLEKQDGSWNVKHFPPMSEARKNPAVICVQHYVVVAGGASDCVPFNTVEVMNTKTKTWSQAACLPEAVSSLTTACCGDQLYFLGGRNKDGSTNSVFTCSVQSLIMSSGFDWVKELKQQASKKLEQQASEKLEQQASKKLKLQAIKKLKQKVSKKLKQQASEKLEQQASEKLEQQASKKLEQQASKKPVWQKAADVPVLRSTCVAINDQLFAVGGRTSRYRPLTDIYCYHPLDDSWQIIGHMPTARSLCIAAFVANKLVVVGGFTERDMPTDVMEIGTFLPDPTLTKKNLLIRLRSLDDWKTLGLQLDIPGNKLREIEDAHSSKSDHCKEETVDCWLKWGKNPSWEKLTEALVDIDHLDIATEIQKRYLQKSTNGSSEDSETPKRKMEDSTEVLTEHLQEKLKTSDSSQLDPITSGAATQSSPSPSGSQVIMEKPRMAELMRLRTVKGEKIEIIKTITPEWKQVRFLMDLDPKGHKIRCIEAEHAHKLNGLVICCQEIFTVWLERSDATWGNLIELLIDSEHRDLAEQVKNALGL